MNIILIIVLQNNGEFQGRFTVTRHTSHCNTSDMLPALQGHISKYSAATSFQSVNDCLLNVVGFGFETASSAPMRGLLARHLESRDSLRSNENLGNFSPL